MTTATLRNFLGASVALALAITMSAAGEDTLAGEQVMKLLRPCPASPNCVSSQTADARQRMAPIPFTGGSEAAQVRLREIILAMPRASITHEEPDYLAVSFRSLVFGFVDEAVFAFDGKKGVIHFRSWACTGYYDFGVNRARMERIAEAFRKDEL